MIIEKEIMKENVQASSVGFPQQFGSVEEIVKLTNANLTDSIYLGEEGIFLPNKKDIGHYYWTDFSLKTKEEAASLIHKKAIINAPENKKFGFFVYNERTNELVPFKENDVLMYDNGDGYLRFDGKNYITYDDDGIEIRRMSYDKKSNKIKEKQKNKE